MESPQKRDVIVEGRITALRRIDWIFVIACVCLSVFSLWGISTVPFHPDESTLLYMSSDLDSLVSDPASLVWAKDNENDPKQHYREIDAPLTRYILGIGRSLSGLSSPQTDWDWSKSWQENRLAGALPDIRLLFAGRLAVTLLLPISLFLIYRIGSRTSNPVCGIFAVLLLGTNALILLHNRRAMAEGALVFGILFALWSFLVGDRHPWLAGIGMALAFNAKYSAIALLPVGLLSVYWSSTFRANSVRRAVRTVGQYLGVFIFVTIALNPYLWRQPIQALQASWASRQELLSHQVSDTLRLAPEQALLSPGKRIAAMTFNLYLLPPIFSEAANYRIQTGPSEETYLSIPGHNLMRNKLGGGILLTLTLFGLASATLSMRRISPDQRRTIVIILLATIAQAVTLILLIPLPWQRYVIPLVPMICIWVAYSLSLFIVSLRDMFRQKNRFST
jgi:4-amino-4-deoxy-L-arabinose transferase-like glycosyltransferase